MSNLPKFSKLLLCQESLEIGFLVNTVHGQFKDLLIMDTSTEVNIVKDWPKMKRLAAAAVRILFLLRGMEICNNNRQNKYISCQWGLYYWTLETIMVTLVGTWQNDMTTFVDEDCDRLFIQEYRDKLIGLSPSNEKSIFKQLIFVFQIISFSMHLVCHVT